MFPLMAGLSVHTTSGNANLHQTSAPIVLNMGLNNPVSP
jgi:hypothetical protein